MPQQLYLLHKMLFNNVQADIYILSYLPAMHINITNLAIFSKKNSLQHLGTIRSVFQTIGVALELALIEYIVESL